jgi:hypothetical protein
MINVTPKNDGYHIRISKKTDDSVHNANQLILIYNTTETFFIHRSDTMIYKLLFLPELHKIELEITTKCNLMCKFCDRRCSQAPSKEMMSLEQVRRFAEESLQLNHQWNKIGILGGEPTLHPHLEEIIEILQTYTRKFPDCDLYLATNYHGWAVQRKVKSLEKKIRVVKSPKDNNPEWFNNINLTQRDFSHIIHNCNISNGTGLGLTPRGYLPCGAGAAIARVLGMDIGLKSLAEVNQTVIRNMLKELCPYCGHGLAIKVGENSSTSPFWEEAYQNYRKKKSGPRILGVTDSGLFPECTCEQMSFERESNRRSQAHLWLCRPTTSALSYLAGTSIMYRFEMLLIPILFTIISVQPLNLAGLKRVTSHTRFRYAKALLEAVLVAYFFVLDQLPKPR